MRRKSGELAHPLNVLLDCGLVVREPDGFYFNFFFSSRRRHTRLTCDWSSDVCSSDLVCTSSTCGRGLSVSDGPWATKLTPSVISAIPAQRSGEIDSCSQNRANSATITFPNAVAGNTNVRSAHESAV